MSILTRKQLEEIAEREKAVVYRCSSSGTDAVASDIPALLAHEAALRGLLRRAMEPHRMTTDRFVCPECQNTVYGGLHIPILPCVCEPGDSWLRDAIAAGLHEEEK